MYSYVRAGLWFNYLGTHFSSFSSTSGDGRFLFFSRSPHPQWVFCLESVVAGSIPFPLLFFFFMLGSASSFFFLSFFGWHTLINCPFFVWWAGRQAGRQAALLKRRITI